MPNIDFSQGYTSSFSLRPVDQSTWASGPSYAPVISASAELDATDEYPLLQAGSCEVTLDVADSFEEGFNFVFEDIGLNQNTIANDVEFVFVKYAGRDDVEDMFCSVEF